MCCNIETNQIWGLVGVFADPVPNLAASDSDHIDQKLGNTSLDNLGDSTLNTDNSFTSKWVFVCILI